jgi:hypothetical protein
MLEIKFHGSVVSKRRDFKIKKKLQLAFTLILKKQTKYHESSSTDGQSQSLVATETGSELSKMKRRPLECNETAFPTETKFEGTPAN